MNFRYRFSKNIKIPNSMKVRPVGAELFIADRRAVRQTDRHDEALNTNSEY